MRVIGHMVYIFGLLGNLAIMTAFEIPFWCRIVSAILSILCFLGGAMYAKGDEL